MEEQKDGKSTENKEEEKEIELPHIIDEDDDDFEEFEKENWDAGKEEQEKLW